MFLTNAALYPGLEYVTERVYHLFCSRAIVSPRNYTANEINKLILGIIPGQIDHSKSIDAMSIIEDTVH